MVASKVQDDSRIKIRVRVRAGIVADESISSRIARVLLPWTFLLQSKEQPLYDAACLVAEHVRWCLVLWMSREIYRFCCKCQQRVPKNRNHFDSCEVPGTCDWSRRLWGHKSQINYKKKLESLSEIACCSKKPEALRKENPFLIPKKLAHRV